MAEKNGTSGAEIMTFLKEANGQYVSGEYLSRCLGITRTAVWKRIVALKKEGYLIESSTKKGYRYLRSEEPYGKSAVLNNLTTQTFGRELKFYSSIDSTNSVLKELASNGAQEGTVVIADYQSKGRGRLGRDWVSVPGTGIWMSVLLKPKLHPMEIQALTLAASVAVCRALTKAGIPGIGIKWPNDILIDDKKVCGILTELSAEADRIAWVITGIGINVNQLESDFPDEIKGTAASLRLSSKNQVPLDRSVLAAWIINAFEEVYDIYVKKGSRVIIEEWKKWNRTLGRRVRLIKGNNESRYVTAKDITSDGRLIVRCDDGTIEEILSGEISLRHI